MAGSKRPQTTEEHIAFLQRGPKQEGGGRRVGTDYVVFAVAGAIAIGFVVWGFVSPAGLGDAASAMLTGTMDNFGWLFVVAAAVFTIFVIVVAASKFGRIPLGKDDERPQFKTSSWVAMMFATGMGIGLVFYGVGEPLFFYLSPPPATVDASSAEALNVAMGQTLFHWTLFPWAMYAIVGLGVGYGTFRLGRPMLFSTMFSSLFGARIVNGVGGRVINILAILATLFGSACSLGLGALQIGGGIQSTGIIAEVNSPILVVIIAVLTAAFVASAVSGIEKGIQLLSNINMWLAVALALIVFVGGPTLFILNVIPTAVGSYIEFLPQMAARTASDSDVSSWLSSWTVFYWAWWISWSPFVGMFIARISRGRTIRQFVVGVLFVPSIISLLWFSIFGGGAIGVQRRAEESNGAIQALVQIVDGKPEINFDTVLFDLLGALPVPSFVTMVLVVLAVVLIAIFFVTGADSASIVMGALTENGTEDPTKKSVVFWGTATGAVAAVMLLAGGDDPSEALNGLKNITIVSALPFVIVMLLLCAALWRDLSRDPLVIRGALASRLLEEAVATGVDKHTDGSFALVTGSIAVVSPEAARADAVAKAASRARAEHDERDADAKSGETDSSDRPGALRDPA